MEVRKDFLSLCPLQGEELLFGSWDSGGQPAGGLGLLLRGDEGSLGDCRRSMLAAPGRVKSLLFPLPSLRGGDRWDQARENPG